MKIKQGIIFVSMLAATLFSVAGDCCGYKGKVVHHYQFKLLARIPRVYNNTCSTGYRQYQTQRILGDLAIVYDNGVFDHLEMVRMENLDHQDSKGRNISYKCEFNDVVLTQIGDNKTGRFMTPTISFQLIAEPSYSIGETVNEDNSIYATIGGYGQSAWKSDVGGYVIRTMNMYGGGAIGCGCSDYGHKSPTRWAGPFGWTDYVADRAGMCCKAQMIWFRTDFN